MKALFICNDPDEQDMLERLFKSNYPKIPLVTVPSSKDGIDQLSYHGPFSLVLIWSGIKGEEPKSIGETISDFGGQRPFIYIGSETIVNDRLDDSIYDINKQTKILTTPYNISIFKSTVNICINWAKQEEFDHSLVDVDRDNYLPMKIRNFYHHKKIPYNAFMEITSTKFVKLIEKHEPYTESQIVSYAQKGVKVLYLEKEEQLKFLEENADNLIFIMDQDFHQEEDLFKVQIQAAGIIHQYLKTVGPSEKIIDLTTKVIKNAREVYARTIHLPSIIQNFPFIHRDLTEQSILSIYFCEAVVDKLGWKSDLPRKQLGLASIIHDCALVNDDLISINSLEDPKLKQFSSKEQEEFRLHPIKAAEIAQSYTGYPETHFIISQHHEHPDGTGFPGGLNSFKLTPLSATFILITRLVSLIAEKGLSIKHVRESLDNLEERYQSGHFRLAFKSLRDIF